MSSPASNDLPLCEVWSEGEENEKKGSLSSVGVVSRQDKGQRGKTTPEEKVKKYVSDQQEAENTFNKYCGEEDYANETWSF